MRIPRPDILPGQRPRRRRGCFGCLVPVLGIFILAGLGVMGMNALLAPWNYTMGGHFHWFPGWQGSGRMHTTTSGGDYGMWLIMNPTIPGYRKSPIRGLAILCSPHGERYRLNFGGDMPRDHGTDLTGVPLHLYMHQYTVRTRLSGDLRPHLDLYGAFGDRELTMDDHGSLARAFNADGTLGNGHPREPRTETVKVVFHEAHQWTLGPSCADLLKP